jgi:hypothetical protein
MTSTAIASKRHLEQLIEEAVVDCYNEEEQATGLFTMIEDNLALPFRTTVLGVTVDVVGVDMNDNGRVVAICRDGKHRQRIALADLPLPSPAPAGSKWIAAYRHRAKHRG